MNAELNYQQIQSIKDLLHDMWKTADNAEIRCLLWTATAALTTVLRLLKAARQRKETRV